eukprot:2918468-Pyramimonas_sp.AAC.3
MSVDPSALFKRQTATRVVKDVQEVFEPAQFHIELKLAVWLLSLLTELQDTATRCPCHVEACRRKE